MRKYLSALALALVVPATGPVAQPREQPQPPSVIFGNLYRAVEMDHVFSDQKTFADAVPKQAPAQIARSYQQQKGRPDFSLKAFVTAHFDRPILKTPKAERQADESVGAYIKQMWTVLQRKPDEAEPSSSLLPLNKPYVVPGGRFSEIYYWDSYFAMLGMEQDGRADLARDMLANIASLIRRYGHMPNGNRSYYLSRSQPPFFAAMVELVAAHDGDKVYRTYLPELQAEHDYWMEGAAGLALGSAHRHVVRLRDGTILNRYWDDRAAPRDESYAQDVKTANASGRPAADVYRDLRAGSETGWDFSSRWLRDPKRLSTIRTTAIAPIDLNTLVMHLEQVLSKAYGVNGDAVKAVLYRRLASQRAAAIRRVMWNAKAGLFTDYLWHAGKQSPVYSAATVFPLYFGVATPGQAHQVARTLRARFLELGGLGTTLTVSGQQWDRPNGWAPLQYIAVEGLKKYGETELAALIARRWIDENIRSFQVAGVLVEKYDIEQTPDPGKAAGGGGGEYPLQAGFGWTNGVLAVLMTEYPDPSTEGMRK